MNNAANTNDHRRTAPQMANLRGQIARLRTAHLKTLQKNTIEMLAGTTQEGFILRHAEQLRTINLELKSREN